MANAQLERFNNFVESLLQVTKAGNLDWRVLDDDPPAFVLDGESGRVIIRARNSSGQHPYTVLVQDGNHQTIESMSTTTGDFYHPWEQRIATLFEESRMSALDVTRVYNDLSAEFDLPTVSVVAEREDDIPF